MNPGSRKPILLSMVQYAYLFFIAAITFFPLLWIVISSFKTNSSILSSAISWPDSLHWENYSNALEVTGLPRAFINSLLVSAGSMVLVLLLAFPAAYSASRFRNKFVKVSYDVISLGILVPMVATLLPIKIIMIKLHLTDSLVGLTILYAAIGLPFIVVVLRSFLLSIPIELDESAIMDGAGRYRIVFSIILPVSQNGIFTVLIWQFINSWNEFIFALLLISEESKRTVQIAIQSFVGRFFFDYGGLFASMVLIIIPPIIVFVIFQEKVIAGLTSGAVKG